MKKYKEFKDEIKSYLDNNLSLVKNNWGFTTVYNGWVDVISADIRGFKKIVETKNPDIITKIIQSFVSGILNIFKDDDFKDIYVSSSLNGDEVIGFFKTPQEKDTQQCVNCAIWINTWKELWKKEVLKNLILILILELV